MVKFFLCIPGDILSTGKAGNTIELSAYEIWKKALDSIFQFPNFFHLKFFYIYCSMCHEETIASFFQVGNKKEY